MRHNRLKLVVPENITKAATDDTTELPAVAAMRDPDMRRLRLVDADEGATPDDAA
jgi:hypothetical protein